MVGAGLLSGCGFLYPDSSFLTCPAPALAYKPTSDLIENQRELVQKPAFCPPCSEKPGEY